MPKFDTPQPISVTIELVVGHVRIVASDRTDTVVDVHPSDPADESDVYAAAQVRVDFTNGTLRVIGPKARAFDFSRKTRSADVSVQVPTGSQVSATTQVGDFHCAGRLGDCRLKTSVGNISVERSGPARLTTSAGHVTVDTVAGDATISTGSGKVQIGEIDGTAVVKNSNGQTTIDAVTGNVRVRAANGDIQLDHAGADVDAKTHNGNIRVGEVVRGSTVLATAMGNLNVGVAAGTAAWLEVNTGFGHVHNLMDTVTRPDNADDTVAIRGRSVYGDITISRS